MRMLVFPLLAVGLASCSAFHSNVKGGFSCAAPRGGTCAPSTTIDDAAIHEIEGGKDAAGEGAAPPAGAPHTANRAALRVVYPPWHDGSGHVHKRTVAYVSVDAPGEVPADQTRVAGDAAPGSSLLAIAESAAELPLAEASTAADPSTATGPMPVSAIQAQVREILAKAPPPMAKPVPSHPIAPTAPASAPEPAPSQPADTTFPPQGD
jgi:conjugal transfer pilus assembly protein TraV